MEGGQAELTRFNCLRMVTHLSTNRAQRRATKTSVSRSQTASLAARQANFEKIVMRQCLQPAYATFVHASINQSGNLA